MSEFVYNANDLILDTNIGFDIVIYCKSLHETTKMCMLLLILKLLLFMSTSPTLRFIIGILHQRYSLLKNVVKQNDVLSPLMFAVYYCW